MRRVLSEGYIKGILPFQRKTIENIEKEVKSPI